MLDDEVTYSMGIERGKKKKTKMEFNSFKSLTLEKETQRKMGWERKWREEKNGA